MFKQVVVLGAGSAGLMAALAIRIKMPDVSVKVVRSPEIGIIGVGESTTPNLPFFLFHYLGLSRRRFFEVARPTWKLAVHFLWGPRGVFDYTFEPQMDAQIPELRRAVGYFCDEDMTSVNQQSALLERGKAFVRQPTGEPGIRPMDPFHLENPKYVKALESYCRDHQVTIIDGIMKGAERGPAGVTALLLEDGQRIEGDFFVDASGFRSELLGKVLEEPFVSYSNSLFNDRALVGSWDRTDEPILPYTTAETMNAGWCWRIEHELKINRGYVYSSAFMTDDDAREEFLRKNPKAQTWNKPLKFRSGRYRSAWVQNVMGIGNACGFVEPLESSALMVVGVQLQNFLDLVRTGGVSDTTRSFFNREWRCLWDEIRDFLTLHFWPNTRLNTHYWQHCNNDTDLSHIRPFLDYYQETGPNLLAWKLLNAPGNLFGIGGFLSVLVGNKVPYRNRYKASEQEMQALNALRSRHRAAAEYGVDVKEALQFVRHPNWRWAGES